MSVHAEEHLPKYRVRPRFHVQTDQSIEVLCDKLKASIAAENATCKGSVSDQFATLYLPHDQQHYWSPQLTLNIEESESGTLLRGLYGPKPSVWTLFIFFYAVIAFAIMIISIVGFTNISLDKSGSILWIVPFLILTFLSLYLVAYMGQKIGHEQMVTLHEFLEDSTGLDIMEQDEYN